MFKSIRSLATYVTDMKRARRFYTEILDFKVSAGLGLRNVTEPYWPGQDED